MAIINHEYCVSLEVAKLLKKAGFDWECSCYYSVNTLHEPNNGFIHIYKQYKALFYDHNRTKMPVYSAPTLDVAQRWLREEKNLILLIDITPSYCNGKPMGYKFVIHVSCGNHIWGEWKDTYEEAQEAGIKKALEIILAKGE